MIQRINNGLLICFVLISCASPAKNFEKGNYEKAYSTLIKEFEKGKVKKKEKILLNKSFSEMIKQFRTNADLNYRSEDLRDWEDSYYELDNLIVNYIKGKRWLDLEFEPMVNRLQAEQDSLRLDLAEAYKTLGDELMEEYGYNGNKEIAKDAHIAYERLLKFDEGQYEVYELIDDALEEATLHILIEADSWDYNYKWRVDNKFRYIENESRKYREVYYEDLIDKIDCHLLVEFSKLDIDDSSNVTTDNYSKDIVDRYESYIDSTGAKLEKPIYKTVKASVKCETEIRKYSWEARVDVDFILNYCDYHASNFYTEYVLESKEYTVSGDERALPDTMKDLKNEKNEMKETKIIDEMIDDIFRKVQRTYFR